MDFINYNDTIGQIFMYTTMYITGSEFMTILMMILVMFTILVIFKVPIEWSVVFLMPFAIYVWAFTGQFTAFAEVMVIFLAILFAKRFFLN